MDIEVRGESVILTGYVNAVERYSKPITSTLRGSLRTFVERMRAGVFKTALKRNDNVQVLLNHDKNREIANTKNGTAKLEEDNIGLRAEVTITDSEVVEKARNNKLVGWSFGFYANADEMGAEGDIETRTVTDMDLVEVSILDDSKRPAYNGTSIETRSEGGVIMEIREQVTEEQTTEEQTTESRSEGVDIDVLAEIVANKVLEKMQTSENREENSVEENSETTEEVTEKRDIDYSDFEKRIADIK